jgi:hypothetical protein
VQICLSTVVAVANLCDPVATHLRTGKLAGNPSFEDLPRTSHHKARCEPLYPLSASLCIAFAMF